MFIAFPPIFVVDTKINYGYNVVAPLITYQGLLSCKNSFVVEVTFNISSEI